MLIARRPPIDHPARARRLVQVWRVEDHGYGVEVCQFLEQIDHTAATAESALTAAGYTVVGPWTPEADDDQACERMPLAVDGRGFLMRMFRLYVRPGACHAADPEAAAVVQAILSRLLSFGIPADPATLPHHYHEALRGHLATLRDRATRPRQPGDTPPEVCHRAADQLARILRTLEVEHADSF
ncbi:hypothetical protein [Nocardia amamiensis]|uniref:hypothetical protein n=1 Tax=Nocardia amamiensis TaxID=404578 RepID=UPI0008313FA8|nr:hypothetical protein [Nocardia amamiensis]